MFSTATRNGIALAGAASAIRSRILSSGSTVCLHSLPGLFCHAVHVRFKIACGECTVRGLCFRVSLPHSCNCLKPDRRH
jgi:hypothetical protein